MRSAAGTRFGVGAQSRGAGQAPRLLEHCELALAAGHSGALVGDRLQVTLRVEDHVY